MKTGIYPNMSARKYHSLTDIVSNSYLGRLDVVPALARVPRSETKALSFGKAFHCYTLEGSRKFKNLFVVGENRGHQKKEDKAYWVGLVESNPNKDILEYGDHGTIWAMSKSVHAHPLASKLLKDIVPETSIFWIDQETGIPCKSRPDGLPKGGKRVIIDLKSTANAADYAFKNDCVKYGYAREAGMYTEGYSIVSGIPIDDLIFAFIAVEKTPPFRVEVYTLDEDFLKYGIAEFHRLLNIEKECRANNLWPNFKNSGAVALTKPSYAEIWEGEDAA